MTHEPMIRGEEAYRSDPRKTYGSRKTYSGEAVRQGDVILRRPWQRIVFVGGLTIFVFIVVLTVFVTAS